MKAQIYITLIVMLALASSAFGQDAFDDTRTVYRSSLSGMAKLHTQGWGFGIRKSYRKTGFENYIVGFEFATMSHVKETTTYNLNIDNATGFVYGKLNSLVAFRPYVGKEKELFSKEIKRGVRISWQYLAGPVLGLVKPVYLDVAYPTVSSMTSVATEAYNPDIHTIDKIIGKSSMFKGLDKSSLYPGLNGQVSMNFEYAAFDEMLKAVEVGVNLEVYLKEVPLMAFTENSRFYLTFFVAVQFGKKSY